MKLKLNQKKCLDCSRIINVRWPYHARVYCIFCKRKRIALRNRIYAHEHYIMVSAACQVRNQILSKLTDKEFYNKIAKPILYGREVEL